MSSPSNPRRFGLRNVDSDVVMRAVAICSVVWNHATKAPEGVFGGGMTFLMMLSGLNFARFSLRGGTPATVRAALSRLALRIGFPSLLLLLMIFATLHKFELKELLLVSNWWTKERIAVFPIWYPEVMVQMCLILYIIFLTPIARYLNRPLMLSMALFLVATGVRFIFPRYIWNTDYLGNNLPHLFLWNFTLGWVVFFLVANGPSRLSARLLAFACVALGAVTGWGLGRLDFWWLLLGGALFIQFRTVLLPRSVALVLGIISQSAFAIFLLHRPSFSLLEHFLPAYKRGGPFGHLVFGLIFSISIWVFLTAFGRAYRRTKPSGHGNILTKIREAALSRLRVGPARAGADTIREAAGMGSSPVRR